MTTFFTSHYADLLAKTCLPLSANDLYLYLYFCYYLGLLFVVPAIIMCCTYGLSCYGLWRSTQITMTLQGKKRDVVVKKSEGGAVQSKTTPKEQDDVTSRRRVIKLLILIVVIYIISWGTPLIAQLYAAFVNVDDSKIVRLVSDSLTFLSSSVNPYLFMIMSSKFVPKDHPCLRLCRRRRALTYSKAKGSSVSMTTATTSATNGRDEYANYS
ncbi:arg8-vasotocin receptor-like [Dreissena polymorpha]|uniref:G-protein coupled receptors family 1 profile domain-containing protein n=1 Tax=Dreissena polymorpha TaxID=45954 RepID=A0A9D4CUT4_DREPO|nr:arg8-vasotocin receptor-like [Dreissena polymorpha]KAH3733876.1 hypothetical protein DPMN_040315 [Dreissena polymorpha]